MVMSSWPAYLPPLTAPGSLQQDICSLVVSASVVAVYHGLSPDPTSIFQLEWNHIPWKYNSLGSWESPWRWLQTPWVCYKAASYQETECATLYCLITGLLQTRKWREDKEWSEPGLTQFPVPGGSLKHTWGGREATVLLGSVGLIACSRE